MTHPVDADVVIVGYGPSGVSAANALGALGVRTLVLERDREIYPRARAVTVNDWTLRLFQSVGLDAELLADMDRTTVLRWRTYAGRELMRASVPPSTLGQPSSSMIYQPVMEQTLRRGVDRYADHVRVEFGRDVTGVEQDDDGVTLSARDAQTGAASTVRGRYVLACDGGGSVLRSELGIGLIGTTIPTRWVVIDAKVKRWWPERHLLTFWSDATRPVVDIPLALGNHRWEFPLAPQESEQDFATTDQLWTLLATMGVTPEHVDIHQHAFYRHHVRHAERWRQGRVFLVGDAAHMMPPWAGQGMQSGIRDAFNISWKLQQVLAGHLPDAVLDSYEPERAPDVAQVTAASERLGRVIKMQMTGREKAQALAGLVLTKIPLAPTPPSPLASVPALSAGWVRGPIGDRSAIGRMIPHTDVSTTAGRRLRLDDALGLDIVLLGDELDPSTLLTTQERAEWDTLGARYVAVRSGHTTPTSDDDLIDLDGTLLAWLRRYHSTAVAVRPDRFVAAAHGSGLAPPDPRPTLTPAHLPVHPTLRTTDDRDLELHRIQLPASAGVDHLRAGGDRPRGR